MHIIEVFSCLGTPARLAARVLLFVRYFFSANSLLQSWTRNKYALARFGPNYKWRIWLLFDIDGLQRLETLINEAGDDDLTEFRDAQLEAFRLVAVVGALLGATAITTLSLPELGETNYFARGLFILSLVLSLLAIFFTCIQQRELGFIRRPAELRAWLSNGIRYENFEGDLVFQSSMTAHNLLEAPYEFVGMAITLFIAALGVYLGGMCFRRVDAIGPDGWNAGSIGVFVAFTFGTAFGCSLFGFLLGKKSAENRESLAILDDFIRINEEVRRANLEKAR